MGRGGRDKWFSAFCSVSFVLLHTHTNALNTQHTPSASLFQWCGEVQWGIFRDAGISFGQSPLGQEGDRHGGESIRQSSREYNQDVSCVVGVECLQRFAKSSAVKWVHNIVEAAQLDSNLRATISFIIPCFDLSSNSFTATLFCTGGLIFDKSVAESIN